MPLHWKKWILFQNPRVIFYFKIREKFIRIYFKFVIQKCNSYHKKRWFYHGMQQLLQNVTFITKCVSIEGKKLTNELNNFRQWFIDVINYWSNPVDTGPKLNLHKMFRNVLDVFWTSYLRSIYLLCPQGMLLLFNSCGNKNESVPETMYRRKSFHHIQTIKY